MYKLMLARINAQSEEDSQLANLALMWVSRAKRRLTGRQLQEAVATVYVPGSFQVGQFMEEDITKLELILSATGGLLVIDKNGEVRLVRKSPYFESTPRAFELNLTQTTPLKSSFTAYNPRRFRNTRKSS